MKNGFKLFDFNGVPVYLKYWFFLLFFFFSVKIVLSLFLAVLIHEISHSVMAKYLGYSTDSITIDIFYGAAYIDPRFNESHNDTMKIAVAGPLSNLLTGLLCVGLSIFLTSPLLDFMIVFITVNFLLAILNLIPIFPLDGGRISKSFLSKMFGNIRGKYFNGILSFVLSTVILVYAIMNIELALILFSSLFLFLAYHEIKDTTNQTNIE